MYWAAKFSCNRLKLQADKFFAPSVFWGCYMYDTQRWVL